MVFEKKVFLFVVDRDPKKRLCRISYILYYIIESMLLCSTTRKRRHTISLVCPSINERRNNDDSTMRLTSPFQRNSSSCFNRVDSIQSYPVNDDGWTMNFITMKKKGSMMNRMMKKKNIYYCISQVRAFCRSSSKRVRWDWNSLMQSVCCWLLSMNRRGGKFTIIQLLLCFC